MVLRVFWYGDGVSFSHPSEDITAKSSEKLPAVQVGDPFQEKLLLEASLEIIEAGCVIGIQDIHGIRAFYAGGVPGWKVYGISGRLQPRGACCAPSTTPKRWATHSR
jgi:hypothetical protein